MSSDLSGMNLADLPEGTYLSKLIAAFTRFLPYTEGFRCTFEMSLYFAIPGEEDLLDITDYLLPLERMHVYNLGLVLGISQHKTKAMMNSDTFLDDVIAAWLRREDQVNKKGEPSWTVLVRALEHPRVGQCGISQNIRKEKALH